MSTTAAQLLAREREVFAARTPVSAARFDRARKVFPGGDTRAATFYQPYPTTVAETAGSRLIDVDGNEYVDLLFNYTSMIAGHSHPLVTESVTRAFARTTPVAAPVEGQVELAEEIVRRVDSVEQLRFTNSGTEATMGATRIARASTGRDIVIKTIGGYHGSFPDLDYGLQPGAYPAGIPGSSPLRLIHYNDPDALESVLGECGSDCAALIIEPVMGTAGIIAPSQEFLQAARELTQAAGALLIADEVITFRLGPGGAQQRLGMEPDLTTFGKIIGGGLPVGAVGGPSELLKVLAPGAEKPVALSGTFNGNAATMAAGLATLGLLDDEAYAKLERLGARLAEGMQGAVDRTGSSAHVTHVGSLVNVHFTDEPPTNAGTSWSADADAAAAFHLGLLNRGFFIATRGLLAASLVTTDEEIDAALIAAEQVLAELA